MSNFLFAVAVSICLSTSAFAATPLQEARDLYFQARVGDARAAFQQVLDSAAASPEERSGAALGLARIDWLVDGNEASALAAVGRAIATGTEVCSAVTARARILREAAQPADAITQALANESNCSHAGDLDGLRIEEARAALDVAASSSGAVRSTALARAQKYLGSLSPNSAIDTQVQLLKLDLGLRQADPVKSIDAWRGFFWLIESDAPAGMHVENGTVSATFRQGLQSRASLSNRIDLLRLLIRGGFYRAALGFDEMHRVAQRAGSRKDYAPVKTYFDMRRALDAATLAFNRAVAHGQKDGQAYHDRVETILRTAGRLLQGKGDDPASQLEAAYGLRWTLGETGGFESLHMGHIMQNERQQVKQGTRAGEVQFVVLDNMLSNGFQSWLWDGDASTGGWQNTGLIVQVRDSYTPSVVVELQALEADDSDQSSKRLLALSANDVEALKTHAVAYLPGVQARLARQARTKIADQARTEAAATGQPFSRIFVRLYWNAMVDHSITAHEGRHVLDNAEYKDQRALPAPELEYRAKLSELEFAVNPRLALSNIISQDIGDDTPHGLADARILKELGAWLVANPQALRDRDPGLPILSQLDRLGDDQLREVARSLDPELHPSTP